MVAAGVTALALVGTLTVGPAALGDAPPAAYPAAEIHKPSPMPDRIMLIPTTTPATPVLNNLRVTNLDALGELLAELAEPPLQRLEAVTKRLEETGVANAETVRELKQIISTMATMDGGVSAPSARALAGTSWHLT